MKKITALLAASFLALAASLIAAEEYIAAGSEVTFAAVADGFPAPTFTWLKDGAPIVPSATVEVSEDTKLLILRKVSAADVGSYSVKATNIAGTATSDPIATVLATAPGKPTIRIQAKNPNAVTVSVPKGTRVVVR